MKTRLIPPALIVAWLTMILWSALGTQASAIQITFVQGNPPRNQGQNQPGQNQPGLSPEKKKSLSKFGPEDAFPGANEQEEDRGRSARRPQRSQSASASRPSPTPKPSATPAAAPSPAVTPLMVAKPSPTSVMAALGNAAQLSPPTQRSASAQPNSAWTVPLLSALALIVSGSLIYVLVKLREKIREGSSG